MPPKTRITRDIILEAATDYSFRFGLENLNARALAKEADCSTQPIYTTFRNMEELKQEVVSAAKAKSADFINKRIDDSDFLVSFALAYVELANESPAIFSMVFGRNSGENLMESITDYTKNRDILGGIGRMYGIDGEQAESIFVRVWCFIHGLANLIATGKLEYDKDSVSKIVRETSMDVMQGMVIRLSL